VGTTETVVMKRVGGRMRQNQLGGGVLNRKSKPLGEGVDQREVALTEVEPVL